MEKIKSIKNSLESVKNLVKELECDNLFQQGHNESAPYRIVHLKKNPIEIAINERRLEFEELRKQNKRLIARCELLESGNIADVTRRIDEVGDRAQQIEALTKKVSELQQNEDKLIRSYSRMGREFREVFYLLTGLKVNALKDGVYEISNMYAESEHDKLFLQLASDGTIQLLQNEYSDSLADYITTYLEQADSFPAFLAAITLNLFNSSKDETNISVDMETTVRPGNL